MWTTRFWDFLILTNRYGSARAAYFKADPRASIFLDMFYGHFFRLSTATLAILEDCIRCVGLDLGNIPNRVLRLVEGSLQARLLYISRDPPFDRR